MFLQQDRLQEGASSYGNIIEGNAAHPAKASISWSAEE